LQLRANSIRRLVFEVLGIIAIAQLAVILVLSWLMPDIHGLHRAPFGIPLLMIFAGPGIIWRCRARTKLLDRDVVEDSETRLTLHRLNQVQMEMGRIAGVGGWEFDPATGAATWTAGMYDIFEVPQNYTPAIATSVEHFVGEGKQIVNDLVKRATETGEGFEYTLPFVTAKGRRLWIRGIGKAERRADGSVRLYGALQDVTEDHAKNVELTKARDAAEAANRAKSEFLANMSHEIRTPLTAILGFADLLHEDRDSSRAPERRLQTINTIRTAGQHLLSVINNILDLSKIEVNKMTIHLTETNLIGILTEIESLIQAKARPKNITLELVLENPVPERIISDPTYLRQILSNLVANAVKFTDQGSVKILVSSKKGERVDRLVIDVEDTGPGMTSEQANQIFEPFMQADTGTARKFGGTGLGLTISRRLAKLLGGNLSLVWTKPGVGSRFSVELPLEPVRNTAMIDNLAQHVRHLLAPPTPNNTELQGRILLAEDGPDNQRLISFYLRKAGAKVEVAEDGRVALAMIETAEAQGSPYDLLVTDMQMPEMDGYTLAKTLRDRSWGLPIIALTAHAMAEDRERCIAIGCNDYLTKPINRNQLLKMCEEQMRFSKAAILSN
jgi:signal transduction histidine kinase/ActR/RegA family two-component response regulator